MWDPLKIQVRRDCCSSMFPCPSKAEVHAHTAHVNTTYIHKKHGWPHKSQSDMQIIHTITAPMPYPAEQDGILSRNTCSSVQGRSDTQSAMWMSQMCCCPLKCTNTNTHRHRVGPNSPRPHSQCPCALILSNIQAPSHR